MTDVAGRMLPRYPVYIPSAGRYEICQTPRFLLEDGVPFKLVVQPKEAEEYAKRFGAENVLVLPWNNEPGRKDGLLRSRTWIRQHAESLGVARHWQLDDNIVGMWRRWKARKVRCEAGVALRVCEDFSDRYENVGISGLNYYMFSVNKQKQPPFVLNVHVYSCSLFNHAMPFWWRSFHDDTDICLQALASGKWCTVLFNSFLCWKMTTMTMKGGNTANIYENRDGRLALARELERLWPRVVTTKRRFNRPQHTVSKNWHGFDTKLIRRKDIDWDALERAGSDEYGLEIHQRKEVKSPEIRALAGLGPLPPGVPPRKSKEPPPPEK